MTDTQQPPTYDSRADTLLHSQRVGELMVDVIAELSQRSVCHDRSKTEPPEVTTFDEFTPMLADATYGSDEYNAFLTAMKPALDHHYRKNPHHPEHGETSMEWRPVAGYEGYYEVSSFGDVRSVGRIVPRSGTQGDVRKNSQIRRASVTPKGYLRMQLVRDGEQRNFMVHRLVAEAFLANPGDLPEVNHRDGDKKNNRVTNLEWTTESDNQVHAYDSVLREPSVKYIVHCPELGLTTLGTCDMERAVRKVGGDYERVTAAGIWSAMDRGGKHLNLTFEGTLLAEYRRSRINGMTLVDLVEMIADWKASTERHLTGDLRRSLEINQERFGMSDELVQILANTARHFGWLPGETVIPFGATDFPEVPAWINGGQTA